MVSEEAAPASLAQQRTQLFRSQLREEHSSMDLPYIQARTSRWYTNSLLCRTQLRTIFFSLLTHCLGIWCHYWVATAFFLGFFKRFRPFTLVFSRFEYAVLNFSTSLCSMTVDIFLLLDCALIKHLYSGFLTTGVPSRGSGFVRPSSITNEHYFSSIIK